MMEIVNIWRVITTWFWTEKFWLPGTCKWEDFKNTSIVKDGKIIHVVFPDSNDLITTIPLVACWMVLQILWNRFVANPIGQWYNLQESPSNAAPRNDKLEKVYLQNKTIIPNRDVIRALCEELDWKPIQIERWWRNRKCQDKPDEITTFQLASWRLIFKFTALWYGLYVLWDKPWFWDVNECWYDYPYHSVTSDIWWYYMFQLSFYMSDLVSIYQKTKFNDTDTIRLKVHHFVVITSQTMGFISNVIRFITLLMVLHDVADIFIYAFRLAKCCKSHRLTKISFIGLTITWIITRLIIFPFKILYNTLFVATTIVGGGPAYYVFHFMMVALQILHIVFTHKILKVAYRYASKG